MYVVTLPANVGDPTLFAKRAQEAGADILEIRGDLTPHIEAFPCSLPILVAARGKPLDWVMQFAPEYIDIEIDEPTLAEAEQLDPMLIVSYHDYAKTPSLEELKAMVDTMMQKRAFLIKVATQVNAYADLAVLDELVEYIPKDRECAVLGMGVRAHPNRMLSPWRNTFTYTYLDEGQQAADGQVPLSLYQCTKEATRPRMLGILGDLDVFSLSPLLHNTLFEKHGIDALYTYCLTDDLDDAWQYLTTHNFYGFSVTAPWKQTIIPYLDKLDEAAQKLGTVNTIIKRDGKWIGLPRDSEGLLRGYPCLRECKAASLLGSGGVMPSVIHACQQAGVEQITLYARNQAAREALAKQFSIEAKPLEDVTTSNDTVLINGISADIDMPLPKAPSGGIAIDLRYGHKSLAWLEKAEALGWDTFDGLPMFIHQALAQFELFTDKQTDESDLAVVQELLLSHLSLPPQSLTPNP